jgi:hypothetical protein
MKIQVVEQTINKGKYHKYLPLEYCCERLKHTKYIEMTDQLISFCSVCNVENRYDCESKCNPEEKNIGLAFYYDDTYQEPWEDFYVTDTYYIPLDYCPFCGEKIEVEVVKREDITEEYLNAKREYEKVHDKWAKCDSIKRRNALEEEWRQLSDKMDEMRMFTEYKEGFKQT